MSQTGAENEMLFEAGVPWSAGEGAGRGCKADSRRLCHLEEGRRPGVQSA